MTTTALPQSVLTRSQSKQFRKELPNGNVIVAKVRYDDNCGNGHNSFSVTGDLYDRDYIQGEASTVNSSGQRRYMGSCGCVHDEIAEHFPELEPLLKWHLVSTDGPMHYVANTLYHVAQGNLEYARSSAVWPEATDEELTVPPDELKAKLLERLPALVAEFKKAVESLGFTY